MLTCPVCHEKREVAYSAVSSSLVCLQPDCGWERPLDEEETFRLFFEARFAGDGILIDKALTRVPVEVSFRGCSGAR